MKKPIFTPVGVLTHNQNLRFEKITKAMDTFVSEQVSKRSSPPSEEFQRSRLYSDCDNFFTSQFAVQVKESVDAAVLDLRTELDRRAAQITDYFNAWRRVDDLLEKVHAAMKREPAFNDLVTEIEIARNPESTLAPKAAGEKFDE